MEQITKRAAKNLLLSHLEPEERTDAALARALKVTPPSVCAWGKDDDPIPEKRQYQIRVMLSDMRDRGEPPPEL